MANIKFSAFTQKVVLGDVDFLVGYTGADNVRVAPSVLSSVYLPLAGGTMIGNIHFNDGINANFGGTAGAWELEMYANAVNDAYIVKTATSVGDLIIQNKAADSDIVFSADDGVGGTTTYMNIDGSAENIQFNKPVAVGGANTTYQLNVHEGDMFVGATVAAGGRGIYFQRTGATNAWSLLQGHNGTNAIELREGANTRMFWENGGDVGIGTITPNAGLQITRNYTSTLDNSLRLTGNIPGVAFDNTGASATNRNFAILNGYTNTGMLQFNYSTVAGGVTGLTAMTIQGSDGNIGIGTKTPDEKLHIVDTTGANIILNSNAVAANSGVYMSEGADATPTQNGAYVYYDGTNNEFKIATGAGALTDQLTIDRDTGDATFTGSVHLADSKYVYWGGSNDFYIGHAVTETNIVNSTGNLNIEQHANDADIVFKCDDGVGGTTNYFRVNGTEELTEFIKNTRHNDNVYANFGDSSDAAIYHNGTDWQFISYLADGNASFRATSVAAGTKEYFSLDGGVELTRFFQGANFNDNVKLTFGDVTVPGDLEIYHDGSDSYISDTGTGNLRVLTSRFILNNAGDTENMLRATADGSVELYYDAAKKLETTATGIQVTGQMDITALNTAPASAGAAGVLGEIRYTADYIYVCTATNTWKRTAIATW